MAEKSAVVLLADAVNQLAMAVEQLATITPNSEANYARDTRREAKATTVKVREWVAELIPE